MGYINGWTRESTIKHLKQEFKGKSFEVRNNVNKCLYRAIDGRKCVAGCFMPDALYKTDFDSGCSIKYIMGLSPGIHKSMPLDAASMVTWQTKHDMLNNKASAEQQLRILIEHLNIIERNFYEAY